MKLVLNAGLALAFALALGVLVLSFMLPGRTATLGNDPGCFRALYSRVHPEARVVLIGSSRFRRGFDPDIIGAQLKLPQNGVVNLAHPGVKPLFDYEILRKMLETERLNPEVILAGVVPISWQQLEMAKATSNSTPRDRIVLSNGGAGVEAVAAASPASLLAMARKDEPNAAAWLWNALTLHTHRLENHIRLALHWRSTWETFFITRAVDPKRTNMCFRKRWAETAPEIRPADEMQKAAYKNLFSGAAPTGVLDPQDFLSHPNYLAEREGLRGIAQLAKARGIKAYGLYVAGVHTPDVPAAFFDQFEAEIGMKLLVFPPELRQALGTEHYTDPTHMALQGRVMVSEWLGTRLQQELAAR